MTWLLLAMVVAGGTLSFFQLPTAEDPPFVFRFAAVKIAVPGADAQTVDRLAVGPLEDAALRLPEVEYTEVSSRDDGAVMVVKLWDRYRDVEPIWDRLERALQEAAQEVPPGVQGLSLDRELGRIYGVLIGFTAGEGVSERELENLVRRFQREVEALPETDRARIFGAVPERVLIALDTDAVVMSGVSPGALPEAVARGLQPLPGGQWAGSAVRLRSEEFGDSLERIREIAVPLMDEEAMIRLGGIAEVTRTAADPPPERLWISGKPGLLLGVALKEGERIQDLGRGLQGLQAQWRAELGEAVEISVIADEPERILERRNGLMLNLGQSLCIVSAILIMVLGWREGVVVALLIPLAFLLSFLVMRGVGLGLNHVALGGFIVVLGMLVDNNIVVAERIIRHRASGMAPVRAAVTAAAELHRPLIVSALTTIAAFLPVFLAQSAAGEYTRPLFTVVAITLLAAELLVFTVTPLVSCHFFGNTRWLARGPGNQRAHPHYRRLLQAAIKRRLLVLGVTGLAAGAAIWGVTQIPVRFFPPSDRPLLVAELEMPPGTTIAESTELAERLDEAIAQWRTTRNGLRSWATFAGRSAPRFVLNHRQRETSPEYIHILLQLDSTQNKESLRRELQRSLRDVASGAPLRVSPLEVGPAIGAPVQVKVKGTLGSELVESALALRSWLEKQEEIRLAGWSWGEKQEQIQLEWDEEWAAELGWGRPERAALLQILTDGLPVGRLETVDGPLPVVMQAALADGIGPERLLEVELPTPRDGRLLRLGDIASVQEFAGFPRLDRHGGRHSINVWADPTHGVDPAQVEQAIREWLKSQEAAGLAHPGIGYEFWGEALQARTAHRSLLVQLPWAAAVVLALLVFQMRSFRSAGIVLLTVPLGFIGAVAGLLLTRQEMTFMTLIGLVSLSGIVINGTILLLDRFRLNREAKMVLREALLDAAEQRFRAILLTAGTTICGMLPLIAFGGDFWRPMAIAIASGLTVATVLILLVIPVICSYIFRIGKEKPTNRGN